jgi:hypothetical protein
MARNTPNIILRVWDTLMDSFNHVELASNWDKIDAHDHSAGKGVKIPTDGLFDSAVTNLKIAPQAVSTSKLEDRSVTTGKIALQGVEDSNLKDGAVISAKLSSSAVTTTKIMNDAVTDDKLATVTVRGHVPRTGGSGVGWDATSSGGGLYTVNFSTWFLTAPVVVVTGRYSISLPTPCWGAVRAITASQFTVQFYNLAGSPTDPASGFDFIAMSVPS